jgi:hypothetical protein
MEIVNQNKMIGYIIAHFTFHFNSIFSSKLESSSANICPNCHVFSHTHIKAVERGSKTFGYCCIVS